jgi:hypothetical protein
MLRIRPDQRGCSLRIGAVRVACQPGSGESTNRRHRRQSRVHRRGRDRRAASGRDQDPAAGIGPVGRLAAGRTDHPACWRRSWRGRLPARCVAAGRSPQPHGVSAVVGSPRLGLRSRERSLAAVERIAVTNHAPTRLRSSTQRPPIPFAGCVTTERGTLAFSPRSERRAGAEQ